MVATQSNRNLGAKIAQTIKCLRCTITLMVEHKHCILIIAQHNCNEPIILHLSDDHMSFRKTSITSLVEWIEHAFASDD
jgi:hypothetical protein